MIEVPDRFRFLNFFTKDATLLTEFKEYQKANDVYDQAINLNNKYAEAYDARGDLMIELAKIDLDDSKFKSSIRDFHHAYELNENLDYVFGKIVHTKMLLNDWSDFNKQLKIIENGLENNRRIIKVNFPISHFSDFQSSHL